METQAAIMWEPGGKWSVETITLDPPKAGEVLVEMVASGMCHSDDHARTGDLPAVTPLIGGHEGAGIVMEVGDGVTKFKVGDRVLGTTGNNGGMAEKVVLNAATTYELPAERSFAEGAALILTYGTSIHALLDRGHIKEGDTLLVLGAAGGVGLAAIELGVAFGARVVAAVSSEEKAKVALEAGASDVVIYGRAPFDKEQSKALADAFKKAVGPNGADVIYDAVGGDYADPAIRCMAWEGRYLVVGFPAGIPKLPLNLTLLKSCDVCGVFWVPSQCAIRTRTATISPASSACGRMARSARA